MKLVGLKRKIKVHRAKMEGSYRAGGVFERPDGAENSSVLLLCSASLFTQGGTSNHKINPQVKVTEHCHRRHLDDPGKPDPAFTLNNSKKNLSSRKKNPKKKEMLFSYSLCPKCAAFWEFSVKIGQFEREIHLDFVSFQSSSPILLTNGWNRARSWADAPGTALKGNKVCEGKDEQ